MDPVLECLRAQTDAIVETLRWLVEAESPSRDPAALDRLGDRIAAECRALGATVDGVRVDGHGTHLRAAWPGPPGAAGQTLVLCHRDTVWPVGTLQRMPFRVADGRASGPGSFDMKGGIAQALWAVRALGSLGRSPRRALVLLCTADEEVGSPSSRSLIEAEGRRSAAALVVEPAHTPQGALKTARKGVGRFSVAIRGRASHAGSDPDKGVSAVQELAHQVLRLHALTDPVRGTTVNVGVVAGGTRPNVVAAEARAEVDLRVTSLAEAERVAAAIHGLAPVTPGAEVVVAGGLTRPPLERTPQVVALFRRAQAIAAELGFRLGEGSVGGGSDGAFTAALGIPTLDGLGAVGDGAHAEHEHVIVARMPERAALLARLLEAV
jgi:glutamate carboxypeptidase